MKITIEMDLAVAIWVVLIHPHRTRWATVGSGALAKAGA